MKTMKKLFGLLLMLGLIGGLTGCSNDDDGDGPDPDMIWDFAPIVIDVVVETQDGKDLLNPETEGNMAGDSIYALYKDKSYLVQDVLKDYDSRALLAHFYGLFWGKQSNGKHVLLFGEFQGEKTFENETFVLHWGDGTKDTISFSSKLTWKNHEPNFTRSYKLNGTKVESLPIKIVK